MVHDGRLVMIDLPQVVDLVANPRGAEFLDRDVRNISGWFASRGLPPEIGDPSAAGSNAAGRGGYDVSHVARPAVSNDTAGRAGARSRSARLCCTPMQA